MYYYYKLIFDYMRKLSLLAVAMLVIPAAAFAGMARYTFSDVVIEGQVYEIEAEVKDTKKNDFTRCDYYLDDYADWIGFYGEAIVGGNSAAEVESFCVAHFADRVLG